MDKIDNIDPLSLIVTYILYYINTMFITVQWNQ